MPLGIGIDIIEISRISQAVKKYGQSFLQRVFTDQEIAYCRTAKAFRYPELAVRFAAKEAYAKAVGTGINGRLGWKDIEVTNNRQGQPFLVIKKKLRRHVLLSLSHSREYAVASVYVTK
ncbi:holo-[acyl-carrier-protein] synthase [candidate division WOR-1 bacterium RIFOXYB2_FULL_48_7]|uniref:Holo-[acyl-carrier-protein] synthase n=1 Tax=candidate division WOR-1 bacterium RIFOXYB2_FULL_48_7 TaxID=1802583 RepID=A0A1F4T9N8_UNCSA|nr:MAG: holo-[acyl-carrier-protein] synthase [candidate division WOR-1 bacterium RIFOXYB2_FULL_48_7]